MGIEMIIAGVLTAIIFLSIAIVPDLFLCKFFSKLTLSSSLIKQIVLLNIVAVGVSIFVEAILSRVNIYPGIFGYGLLVFIIFKFLMYTRLLQLSFIKSIAFLIVYLVLIAIVLYALFFGYIYWQRSIILKSGGVFDL